MNCSGLDGLMLKLRYTGIPSFFERDLLRVSIWRLNSSFCSAFDREVRIGWWYGKSSC